MLREACKFDPIRIFRPINGTVPEEVLSDSVVSRRVVVTMVRGDDDVWRQSATEVLDRAPEDTLCPA